MIFFPATDQGEVFQDFQKRESCESEGQNQLQLSSKAHKTLLIKLSHKVNEMLVKLLIADRLNIKLIVYLNSSVSVISSCSMDKKT